MRKLAHHGFIVTADVFTARLNSLPINDKAGIDNAPMYTALREEMAAS